MTVPKDRKQEAFEDLNELLGYYAKDTKGETMAAQIGFMMAWLSRLSTQDWVIRQELDARLKVARQRHSSSGGTLKPPVPRP
jgi:hypothetical protein